MKEILKRICAAFVASFLALCTFFPIQTERVLHYVNDKVDGIETVYGANDAASATLDGKEVLTLHFVDVDQAKAIVVQAPSGEFMLVDAGSDASEPMLLSYLDRINPGEFELAVFTHPHEDHIGGADAVLKEYNAKLMLLPEVITNTSAFENMLDLMEARKEQGSEIVFPSVGQRFMLGDVSVTVLSPEIASEDNLNNSSIVLKIEWHEADALLTGDAELQIEKALVQSGIELDAEVFDAGHHGSDTSSTEEFLRAVNPQIAVISCGVDNSYGHPSFSVISRLNRLYIPFYRTDKQGTVVVRLDKDGNIDVECLGKGDRRFR